MVRSTHDVVYTGSEELHDNSILGSRFPDRPLDYLSFRSNDANNLTVKRVETLVPLIRKQHHVATETRICAEVLHDLPAASAANNKLGGFSIEDASFTALGANKIQPIRHKFFGIWLLRIGDAVVCEGSLLCNQPELTDLGLCHTVIGAITQRDAGGATNTTNDDDFRDVTHDVVAFQATQLPALGVLKGQANELHEFLQRLRA